MYRRIPVVAAAVLSLFCLTTSARAQEGTAEHKSVGVGFHQIVAPLGVRWWLSSQKVGIDLGVGFRSEPSLLFPSEKLKSWAIAGGVPIVLKSWPRVHALFRPGVSYESQDFELPGPTFSTDKEKTLRVSGEIEGEAFLLENFSVSASTGILYESFDPGQGADKQNTFETVGANFTTVGFHLYMFH